MFIKFLCNSRFCYALLLAGFMVHTSVNADQKNRIKISNNPAEIILEYRVAPSLIEDEDYLSLRIFGDGEMHVHYPLYMKKSGNYQAELTDDELISLFQYAADERVLEFDETLASKELENVAKIQTIGDQSFRSDKSDGTDIEIDFSVTSYTNKHGEQPLKSLHKKIKWRRLKIDAEKTGEKSQLKRLSRFEKRLNSLLQHPTLKRMANSTE